MVRDISSAGKLHEKCMNSLVVGGMFLVVSSLKKVIKPLQEGICIIREKKSNITTGNVGVNIFSVKCKTLKNQIRSMWVLFW